MVSWWSLHQGSGSLLSGWRGRGFTVQTCGGLTLGHSRWWRTTLGPKRTPREWNTLKSRTGIQVLATADPSKKRWKPHCHNSVKGSFFIMTCQVSQFPLIQKHLPIKRDDFYFPILVSLYTYSKYMIVLYNLFVIKVVLHYLLGWKFSHINLEVSYPLFVVSKGSRNKLTCLETVT